MKTLFLYRHGKSDWDADYYGDYNRPLAKRGKKAADLMGRFLQATRQVPDVIISSGALRAWTTVIRSIEAGAWNVAKVITKVKTKDHSAQILDAMAGV